MIKVKGVQQVRKAMLRASAQKADKYSANLRRAGLFLQRESQNLCPVDTGNLRRTAFTRSAGKGFKTVVAVGYTAAYAVFVHENLDALHGDQFNKAYAGQIKAKIKGFKTKRSQEQAKFLEAPMRAHRRRLLRAIAGKGI